MFTGRSWKQASSSTSLNTSRLSVDYIRTVMEKLKNKQTRESTTANYLNIWRKFNNFVIRLDKRQTSWEDCVVLYGTYLVEMGTQSSTIKSYFSAIKHILRTDGYDWNDDKAMLTTITKSCKLINDTVQLRLPISRGLLDLILYELERLLNGQPYLLIMYKAIFALAYYGLMRIGELTQGNHPILAKDIHIASNKDKILLVLHTSKTHGKESYPQKIKIEATNIERSKIPSYFCPFSIARTYMKIQGNYLENNEQLFVFSNRSTVKPDHVRAKLKAALCALNLDPVHYGMHSMRAGHATDMYKQGYSISEIKKAGRWKSNAVYKYLKP